MINYGIEFTLISDNKKLLKYAKQNSLFSRLCEVEEEFHENSLQISEEEDGIRLTGYICKPTVNRSGNVQKSVSKRIFSSTQFLTYQEKRYQVEI